MKTTIKLASAAAAIMTVAGSTSAFAHGPHHGFKMGFHHQPHFRLYLGGGGCGFYYDRWLDTGRLYWKRKYYVCKGWW